MSYESPSRRVSRESLGDWALIDALAQAALQLGRTEAELIHALLEDRQRLKTQLADALFTSPHILDCGSRHGAATTTTQP